MNDYNEEAPVFTSFAELGDNFCPEIGVPGCEEGEINDGDFYFWLILIRNCWIVIREGVGGRNRSEVR